MNKGNLLFGAGVVLLSVIIVGCTMPLVMDMVAAPPEEGESEGGQDSLPLLQAEANLEYQPDPDWVPCDPNALLEAFYTQGTVELTPGCVYEFSSDFASYPSFQNLSSSPNCAAIFSLGDKSVIGNGATIRIVPGMVETSYGSGDYVVKVHSKLFFVPEGHNLLLENLTIEGAIRYREGAAVSTRFCNKPGLIDSHGSLGLKNVQFLNNLNYGAMISSTGTLRIEDGLFEGNSSQLGSGAITADGDTQIKDSIFRNNQTPQMGGAIFNRGTMTLENVTFDGNVAKGGGGIANLVGEFTFGSVTIKNSAIINNYGRDPNFPGGGIYNEGTIQVINTTISHNFGHGIYNADTGDIDLQYVTIANNMDGFGIRSNGGAVSISNVIFANNEDGNCEVSSIVINGPGLSEDLSCGFVYDGFIIEDPLLGPLANNGGPTLTHAIPDDSPAVDAATGDCPDTDQRNILRADGAPCDIGAFEIVPYSTGYSLPENLSETTPSESSPFDGVILGRMEAQEECFAGPGMPWGIFSWLQENGLVEVVGISENGEYLVVMDPCHPTNWCWVVRESVSVDVEVETLQIVHDPEIKDDGGGEVLGCLVKGLTNAAPTCVVPCPDSVAYPQVCKP